MMPRTDHQLAVSGSHSSLRQHPPENFIKLSADQQDPFEKMAYRPHKDDEFEDDQIDHGSVSLAGIIKLQPSRRKGNKTWRPMQASDLGESGTVGGDASFHFDDTEGFNGATVSSILRYPFGRSHTKSSVPSYNMPTRDHLGDMYDGTNAVESLVAFAQAGSQGNRQSEMHYTMAETRIKLFGNLPDAIRLHEQTGKFDGQIVFIGHTNRDVSAHQWSSSSFQWVNIGRYSHSRGKVEGSLASDCLRGIDEPHDTLEYFKLAAENRQTLIIENGRPKDHTTAAEHALHVDTKVVASAQTYTDTSIKSFRVTANTQSETGSSLPSRVHSPFVKDVLEDPFVAAANTSVSQFANGNHMQSHLIGSTGSLDLTYRFPTKAITTLSPNIGASTFAPKSTGSQALNFLSAPILHEVAFGEEAATQRDILPANSERFQGLPSSAHQKSISVRSQLPVIIDESRLTIPAHDGVAQSTANFKLAARYARPTHPATPLTYLASNLSAAAVPYVNAITAAAGSGACESNASTVNATAVGLHYSDPDGLRRTQHYEVANGLNQQAPTPQSFKGPFFSESKPTTHDPTVALSVRISEEEKLMNWFRDGHRPARQREYTKSLIAAAATSDNTRHFGAIGEASVKHEKGPYANTAPFVRLYENLSEYVEEYRNGSGQSCFTRRWKPAAPQLRDLGSDSSTSYFSKRSTEPSWPGGALLRPSDRMWG